MTLERHEHRIEEENLSRNARRALQQEALSELSASRDKNEEGPDGASQQVLRENKRNLKLDDEDKYQVKKGDTLWSIARRSLSSQDKPTDTDSIYTEMGRIARINFDDYPQIWEPPHKISTKMQLRLVDGLDTAHSFRGQKENECDPDRQWTQAPTGYTAKAKNCDRVEAGEGSVVVGYKGSEVILKKGSRGFAFPGSHFEARDGSAVITVGGTVEARQGSRVREVAPSIIIEE